MTLDFDGTRIGPQEPEDIRDQLAAEHSHVLTAGSAVPTGRIALFLPTLTPGGAERVMVNLARGLAERGCSLDIVLPQAIGLYLRDLPPAARVIDLGAGGRPLTAQEREDRAGVNDLAPGKTLRALPALVRYLRRERPQALIGALEHANIVALLAGWTARMPTRIIVTIHNTVSREQSRPRGLADRLTPGLAARLYPGAHAVVAVSGGVADDFSRVTRLPRGRIDVVYNPVLTPELTVQAGRPVDHPWFAPGQPPVILGVGRLIFQKDFATLLRAFALVRQTRPVRLAILGDGVERPQLERLARELEVAEDLWMPGFVENPYAFMARSAAFALSSRYEGLPTVLIEALAVGLPVVATDCPHGPAEILAEAGQGTLVPVGDPSALAQALRAALEAQAVPPPTLDKFGPAYATARYLELLR